MLAPFLQVVVTVRASLACKKAVSSNIVQLSEKDPSTRRLLHCIECAWTPRVSFFLELKMVVRGTLKKENVLMHACARCVAAKRMCRPFRLSAVVFVHVFACRESGRPVSYPLPSRFPVVTTSLAAFSSHICVPNCTVSVCSVFFKAVFFSLAFPLPPPPKKKVQMRLVRRQYFDTGANALTIAGCIVF